MSYIYKFLTSLRTLFAEFFFWIIMRPSSLGGGRILRRTLSVRLSVCPSVVCLSVRPVIVAIGNVFSSTASVTDVLFGTHWGPHIVRPSRPHKFLFSLASLCSCCHANTTTTTYLLTYLLNLLTYLFTCVYLQSAAASRYCRGTKYSIPPNTTRHWSIVRCSSDCTE